MKAIVVDDSRTTRLVLSKMLGEIDVEVSTAGDGREALEVLEKEGAPDLMLIDWNMPVMNGYELVEAVRADSSYDSVRLMMVTTETGMENVMQALEAGANEYVMKPFTKDTILEKLAIMGLGSGR